MSSISISSRIKAVFVFQIKLGLDALRDFALSPISLVCALLDIVFTSKKGEGYFDRLLSFGRKTDHWINLFNHHDELAKTDSGKVKVDDWISELESVVKARVKQGKMTESEQKVVEQFLLEQHEKTDDITNTN